MLTFLTIVLSAILLVFAIPTARAIWYVKSGQHSLDQRMTNGFSR